MDKRLGSGIAAEQVTRLLDAAALAGADPSEILARAQVPYTMAELSGGAAASLTRRHLVAIYRECIVTIGWHSSQLDRKPQMHPDEFRLMCYCVISSRDLRNVILRQSMFFRTRGDRLSVIQLEDDGPIARVIMDTLRRRKNFASFLSDLAGVSIFCRLYAWLLGIDLHDFSVELAYNAAYANDALSGFFVGHLGFGAPANSISFPRVLLDQPVIRSPEELDDLLVEFPFDFMSARTYEMALPDRIRSIYSTALARGTEIPTLDELARLVGASSSTIRRRLDEDRMSIRSLKDSARCDAVLQLLQQRRSSISEAALAVGFRDLNSFRAAFRRWTGMSPTSYLRTAEPKEKPAP